MLSGIARKISLPFILLSASGWILFGVGFGIRNFAYKELSDKSFGLSPFDSAAKPEFFLFWTFALGGLLVYILSFVYSFGEHVITKLLFNIFIPVYLLGAGGVLLVDGLLIYRFYQYDNGNVFFFCADVYHIVPGLLMKPDIHNEEKYGVIEFTGVVVSLLFYWVYLIISSFFATPKKVYA